MVHFSSIFLLPGPAVKYLTILLRDSVNGQTRQLRELMFSFKWNCGIPNLAFLGFSDLHQGLETALRTSLCSGFSVVMEDKMVMVGRSSVSSICRPLKWRYMTPMLKCLEAMKRGHFGAPFGGARNFVDTKFTYQF